MTITPLLFSPPHCIHTYVPLSTVSYVSNVPEKTLPIFAPPYYLIWRLYHKKEVNLIECSDGLFRKGKRYPLPAVENVGRGK
jgi:hypothetical protein